MVRYNILLLTVCFVISCRFAHATTCEELFNPDSNHREAVFDEGALLQSLDRVEALIARAQSGELADLPMLERLAHDLHQPKPMIYATELLSDSLTPAVIAQWRAQTDLTENKSKAYYELRKIVRQLERAWGHPESTTVTARGSLTQRLADIAKSPEDRLILSSVRIHPNLETDLKFVSTDLERLEVIRDFVLRIAKGEVPSDPYLDLTKRNYPVYKAKLIGPRGRYPFIFTHARGGTLVVLQAFNRNEEYSRMLMESVMRRYDSLIDSHKNLLEKK